MHEDVQRMVLAPVVDFHLKLQMSKKQNLAAVAEFRFQMSMVMTELDFVQRVDPK